MQQSAALAAHLAALHSFWQHWGFVFWQSGPFAGVSRRQHFVKDGIIGSVAEYHAWEAIVWTPGSADERETLWKTLPPMADTITQRFLFLLPSPWPERRIRSYWFGLRGYLEFFAYYPGLAVHAKANDLTGLVDLALKLPNPPASP